MTTGSVALGQSRSTLIVSVPTAVLQNIKDSPMGCDGDGQWDCFARPIAYRLGSDTASVQVVPRMKDGIHDAPEKRLVERFGLR
jgi:hypothetical protein